VIYIGLTEKNGPKAELLLQLRKISLTLASTSPLISVEATGVCFPIGNAEIFLAAIYTRKSPQGLWSDTDITELLGFRNKSILAVDLNAKLPVWHSKVSYP
jgi:hypothetical protein